VLDAYAWLVSAAIALLLAGSLLTRRAEAAGSSLWPLAGAAVLALAGAIYAARRGLRLRRLAGHFAAVAACPHCGSHGRFGVVRSRLAHGPQRAWMDVRCLDCGRDWRIEAP
jgi:ribosomal protein S27E